MGPHLTTAERIADLEMRLMNYRRTRQLSPSSMLRWCDTLIRDAETELRRLTATGRPDRRSASGSSQPAVLAADARVDAPSTTPGQRDCEHSPNSEPARAKSEPSGRRTEIGSADL